MAHAWKGLGLSTAPEDAQHSPTSQSGDLLRDVAMGSRGASRISIGLRCVGLSHPRETPPWRRFI